MGGACGRSSFSSPVLRRCRGLRPEGARSLRARASRQRSRAAPQPTPPAGFDTIVKPFLAENCFTCHGNKKQENDLNLQSFDSSASLVEHRDQWDEVVGKLRRGEMPPLEEEQPPEEQRQAVATWLARELERIDAATPPDPGRVTARRLNRTEYNNTIKELLGVDIRPADDFPQDDAGYGFDNIADVLSLSPVLMEKYVSAADRVARVALFGPPAHGADADPPALGGPPGRSKRGRSPRRTTSPASACRTPSTPCTASRSTASTWCASSSAGCGRRARIR